MDLPSRPYLSNLLKNWLSKISFDGWDTGIEGQRKAFIAGANAALKSQWNNVDADLPDYNVSVMVFIPEEDNHITAGMLDVSGKWILLDEYREPQGNVTHWMPMPFEPKYKKI